VADTSSTKRALTTWSRIVERKAADSIVNQLSASTPKITGKLERARTRRDTETATTFTSTIEQPGGADEPDLLPNWLDTNTRFQIVPRRATVLRFRGRGGQIVFAPKVDWRPRPGSVRFWSRVMTQAKWQDALERVAPNTKFVPE